MIDAFDYKEPLCLLSGGKDFYHPKKDAPTGRIPVSRVIEKADEFFGKNDFEGAGRLLNYWKNEAVSLGDKEGELAAQNELVGFYRKKNDKENALRSVLRSLDLVSQLQQKDTASGATVLINCATAYKAFDMLEEALILFFTAEEIYKKVLSGDDSRFGALYNNMALALSDFGNFEKAEKAYFSALDVMKNVPNGEAEAAITYVNLAHLYEKFGKDEKTGSCMEKAYELLLSENLPRNGNYAFVLEKCAPSFAHFGNNAAFEKFKRESEEIYERA